MTIKWWLTASLCTALLTGCTSEKPPPEGPHVGAEDAANAEIGAVKAEAQAPGGAGTTTGAADSGAMGTAATGAADSGAMGTAATGAAPAAGTSGDAGTVANAAAGGLSSLFKPAASSVQGQPAPEFSLATRAGETVALSGLKGKVVVVNFWATWCKPCVEELPSLERLRRQLKGSNVEIVGISVDDSWDPVDKLLAQHPVRFPIVLDTSRATPERFGTSKFPETFILDGQGRIARKLVGAQIWDRGDMVGYLKDLTRS